MRRTYTTCLLIVATVLGLYAGTTDQRAQTLLDRTAEAYRQAGGISIRFGGTQQGTLLLKGECFYLECGGVQSWFDGETQWSYVEQNGEVTVSKPSPEELQGINPYALINSYTNLFDYRYGGKQNIKGQQGNEIILTPRDEGEIQSVALVLSDNCQPLYITVTLANGQTQEFRILSYRTHQPYTDATFRFDTQKYPDVEIIDMR